MNFFHVALPYGDRVLENIYKVTVYTEKEGG
jgi:hypothetical protein